MLLCLALALPAAGESLAPKPSTGETAREVPLRDRAWSAYRPFYEYFARFQAEQHKNYSHLRVTLRVVPAEAGVSLEGATVQLVSGSVDQTLKVDPMLGVELPLLKRAYEEDGILRVNRAKGEVVFGTRHSIQVRPEGMYTPEWLKRACQQMLAAKAALNLSHRLSAMGKSCKGVTFHFRAAGSQASVVFRDMTGRDRPLPTQPVKHFPGATEYPVTIATYTFGDWPEQGQLITRTPPVVIDFVIG